MHKYTRRNSGFSMVELTISMAIMMVVSGLSFVVVRSTTSATAVAQAKEMAQASVRDAMTAMTRELALASKKTNAGLIPPLQALTVVSPTEIVFQLPTDTTGIVWSQPIRYRFENEDAGTGTGAGNARLDAGEDKNGDGMLTRRIVRTQGDTPQTVGGANDLSAVQFALNPPTNDVLTITLTATKAINNRRHDRISATATSRVYLVN